MRIDGWFGLCAGETEGMFQTYKFWGGERIYANADVQEDGSLNIELLDENGAVLRSVDIRGNGVKLLAFKDIDDNYEHMLRIRMRKAVLYSLSFE